MGLVFRIQTRGGATESAQDNRISTHIQLFTKDGSPVRSEFAFYVLRTLNRTVLAFNVLSVPYHYKKGVPYSSFY